MAPVSFFIVGSGWRTEFFLRVGQGAPDRFRCTGVVTRSAETGAPLEARFGVRTFRDVAAARAADPSAFAVVSVPQPVAPKIIAELAGVGVPVLTETPPAPTVEGLLGLWPLVARGAKIQVAEQYAFQPLHAARLALIRAGRIGTPSFAHVSYAHGYHGVSLIRRYLGLGYEPATISARAFEAPILKSPDRKGPPAEEATAPSRQVIAQLDFGQKLGIFDFTDDQYFSWIRGHGLVVRGERGEIRDGMLRYLEDIRTPIELPLLRRDAGGTGNLEGFWHQGYTAGAAWVYRNPFPEARLSDDEIAVAVCIEGMRDYVDTGRDIYSFAEAAQDQVLSLAIAEAAREGRPVRVEAQPWADYRAG
jgi:predicted dehydrogenase